MVSNQASETLDKAEQVATNVLDKAVTVATDVHDTARERILEEMQSLKGGQQSPL